MGILFTGTFVAFGVSVVATCTGAGIGILFGNMGKRFFSAVLGLTAGIMMAIVCFELLPDAFVKGRTEIVIAGILSGVVVVIILDSIITLFRKRRPSSQSSKYTKTALLLAIGIGLHKLPEGLAVGSTYVSSSVLGISIAIIIGLHDIPEGFAVAVPMKLARADNFKILKYAALTQVPMGIGAFIGGVLGTISAALVAFSLAFAAGAMLYITCSEIIPQSNELHRGRLPAVADVLGFVIGILISMYI